MPRSGHQTHTTVELDLFAYLVMHGIEEVDVSRAPDGRFVLRYRDPDGLAPGLKAAFETSESRQHAIQVRRLCRLLNVGIHPPEEEARG